MSWDYEENRDVAREGEIIGCWRLMAGRRRKDGDCVEHPEDQESNSSCVRRPQLRRRDQLARKLQ